MSKNARRQSLSRARVTKNPTWNNRRLARTGLAVLTLGVLVAVGVVYFSDHQGGVVLAVSNPIDPPLPEPGSARPWEVEIQVSTYSSVHTRHGNMLTVIPLVGWSGRGPDMSMSLIHNSANVDSTQNLTAGMGFDMGPGWTISYGGQIILDDPLNPTTATVISGDGTQTIFTRNGTEWSAPAGSFDTLTWSGSFPIITFTVTHKDQSFETYKDHGDDIFRFGLEKDATGNSLGVAYIAYLLEDGLVRRPERISDSVGRRLLFEYDAVGVEGRLSRIRDPRSEFEGGPPEPGESTLPDYRDWQFSYDSFGRLETITDAMDYNISITYDIGGRIATITDKKGSETQVDTYEYYYDAEGRLKQVTDPYQADGTPGLTQLMRWESYDPEPYGDGFTLMFYTDRRGNDWEYDYQSAVSPQAQFPDGDLAGAFPPSFGEGLLYEYDYDRNVIAVKDFNGWQHLTEYAYDGNGNLLTRTRDPGGLNLVDSWTYDALNNVTSYTDGELNTVQFFYELSSYPTLLTRIEEPATATLPVATTDLTYFTSGNGRSQIESATDPNLVRTQFTYDAWGQLASTVEGVHPDVNFENTYRCVVRHDSGGRLVWTHCSPCSEISNSNGNGPSGGKCVNCKLRDDDDHTLPDAAAEPSAPAAIDYSADWSAGYTTKGQLQNMELDLSTGAERDFDMNYDELGRLTDRTVSSSESGAPGWLLRQFAFTYSAGTGETWRIGPDGSSTYVRLDENGRVAFVSRGGIIFPKISASYTYGVDGLMLSVAYGNGTRTEYTYDAARRVTSIDHRRFTGMQYETMLKLVYAYQDNDLVAQIDEYDQFGLQAGVAFAYDTRGRLISEVRTGDNAYDLAYEYDQGGNRTLKTQSFSSTHWLEVRYTYDISDPIGFGTAANRLMRTETYDVTVASVLGKMKAQAAAFGPTETLLSSTWYYYNGSGNVTLMSTSVANPAEGEPNYFETVFSYARNEKAVTAISGTTPGSGGNPPTSFARGFRYDAARERYRNNDTWSDYDQDWIYGDYLVDPTTGEVTEKRAYLPGIARVEDIDAPGTPPVRYYHTDMIGTTRFVTTLSGQPTDETVYTAFGEKVCSLPGGDCTNTTDHRYGYAGAYGYQSTINDTTGVADFPFLHVGARYYDPALGRFLQRDPIGIRGGLNVYEYVRSAPTLWIDWDGTGRHKLRDPKTGKFKKSPWWKKTAKKAGKRIPIYLAACAVARIGHKIAGKPYEDPHDVFLDTVENLIDGAKNWWRDRQKRKENPGAFVGAG